MVKPMSALLLGFSLVFSVVVNAEESPEAAANAAALDDVNQKLRAYNQCFERARKQERKSANPDMELLKVSACQQEAAAIEAAIPPGMRQQLDKIHADKAARRAAKREAKAERREEKAARKDASQD